MPRCDQSFGAHEVNAPIALPTVGTKDCGVDILIQNCQTREYLCQDGTWTKDLSRALHFASSLQATNHCEKIGINHAQVLLKFGRKELDVTLPVSQNCEPPAPPLPRSDTKQRNN